MNKSSIRHLAISWIGTMGLVGLSQSIMAGEPGAAPQITVYVYNQAQVEPHTLQEAKKVAIQIFRKAGVEAAVLDALPPSTEEQGKALPRARQARFYVQILSRPMAESFGLLTQVLGIAPGTSQELNRDRVYVFDHVAEELTSKRRVVLPSGVDMPNARKGQILGHGIAHEIEHVLLHQDTHSPAGIMRANWDRKDFQNMVAGGLWFTSEEAARVREEVRRRNAPLTAR